MKGSILDMLIFAIVAFIFAVGVILANTIMQAIDAGTASTFTSAAAQAGIQGGLAAVGMFDWLYPLIMVGLVIGGVIFAIMIPSHPIMIVPTIICIAVFMVVIPPMANAYELVAANPMLTASAVSFPLIGAIMGNLPTIALVFGVLLFVAMFLKYQSGGNP